MACYWRAINRGKPRSIAVPCDPGCRRLRSLTTRGAQSSKLAMRVRFLSPAPRILAGNGLPSVECGRLALGCRCFVPSACPSWRLAGFVPDGVEVAARRVGALGPQEHVRVRCLADELSKMRFPLGTRNAGRLTVRPLLVFGSPSNVDQCPAGCVRDRFLPFGLRV